MPLEKQRNIQRNLIIDLKCFKILIFINHRINQTKELYLLQKKVIRYLYMNVYIKMVLEEDIIKNKLNRIKENKEEVNQ